MGTHQPAADDAVSKHMVAEATLAAHFVDAALKAGMDRDAINAVLRRIADETVISEFWVSDENGEIAFTNIDGVDFTFPTDPAADSQAAPFAALLTGDQTVVVQDAAPRCSTVRSSGTSPSPAWISGGSCRSGSRRRNSTSPDGLAARRSSFGGMARLHASMHPG